MTDQLNLPVPDVDAGPITPPLSEVEANLAVLASVPRLPNYCRTRNVREQFQHAFELIGGIPRLAHWAHEHPDKFYSLYSKLIPARVEGTVDGTIKVELSWVNGRDTSGRSPPAVIDVEPLGDNK